MASYTKATDFAAKDALLSGDPAKIIKGTEIDNEFNAISVAVSTKADTVSPTFTGTPTAPTASPGTNTTQVATTAFTAAAVTALIPAGIITMWSGSVASIPSGWLLCNGSSGTPDLRNRFIVGAGSTYSVAATGGSADAIVVTHTHTATSTVTDPGHTHTTPLGVFNSASSSQMPQTDDGPNAGDYLIPSNTTGITVATTNSTEGSSGTNANLPPYYALAYIMKS